MRTVSVAWDPTAERFTGQGGHPGQEIMINAPHAVGTHHPPTGFSATELLLAAAGACSAWDVLEILRKQREEITSLDVTVEGHQEPTPPWAYERVVLHFRIAGAGLAPAVLQRVVRLSCVRYCSVLATMRGVSGLEATVELLDTDGTSSGRLPVSLSATAAETLELAALVEPPAADEG